MPFDTHQLKAIEDNSDSLIITAGAGSGKTTTMIGRVLRALNHRSITKQLSKNAVVEHLDPETIQVVSFTNVAANTFKERLSTLSNGVADKVGVSTLDKFAIQIIQHIYPKAKCDLDEHEIAKVLYNDLNHITHLQDLYPTFSAYFNVIDEAQRLYARSFKKETKKAIYDDFIDDYVEYVVSKYKKTDEFSIPLQSVYKFAVITMIEHNFIPDLNMLIVDELQDTSDEQFVLLNFLQSQLPNMKFVGIGDVSQSMYRWNNAKPQRVSQYVDEYNATLLTLPNNYRSHPEIIDLANNLLKYNIDNIASIQLNAKSKINFEQSISDENRVRYIGGLYSILPEVKKLIARGIQPSNIAILGRSGSPLNKVQDIFKDTNVKINSKHNDKNKRIGYLSYVSRKLSIFLSQAEERNEQLNHITRFLEDNKLISDAYALTNKLINIKRQNNDKYYQELILELRKHKLYLNEQLRNLLYKSGGHDVPDDEVIVSTVHGVKGDEFDYVFYIPPRKSCDKEVHVDPSLSREEKELLWGGYAELQNIDYVAVTRAREQLSIISYDQDFEAMHNHIETCKKDNLPYNKDVDALLSHLKN